jgi:hypothetical protein
MELVSWSSGNVALVKQLFKKFLLPCRHRGNATEWNWYRGSRLDSMGVGDAFVVGWYVGMGGVHRGGTLGIVQRKLVSWGLRF